MSGQWEAIRAIDIWQKQIHLVLTVTELKFDVDLVTHPKRIAGQQQHAVRADIFHRTLARFRPVRVAGRGCVGDTKRAAPVIFVRILHIHFDELGILGYMTFSTVYFFL